jgi:hypothetical protein
MLHGFLMNHCLGNFTGLRILPTNKTEIRGNLQQIPSNHKAHQVMIKQQIIFLALPHPK